MLILAGAEGVRCGFPNHQLWLNRDVRRVLFSSFQPIQKSLSGYFAHAIQRLPYGSQTRTVEGGSGNIVESKNGYILGHADALFLQSSDRSDRRHVIVGKDRGEWLVAREQLLGEGITQHGRGVVSVNLNRQFRIDAEADLCSHVTDRIPSVFGIRA